MPPGQGLGVEEDLTVKPVTVMKYSITLLLAMKNEQRMDPQGKYEHLDNMWNWIKTDLTPGLGLNTQRVDDPLATAAYITIAMDLLRTDATIRQLSFGDPKEIHHFALRILLQQDTACRIGDVTNLKWHQIQFFLFPQGEDGI